MSAGAPGERPKPDVAATAAWLVDGARSANRSQDVLSELCARLIADGLPLWRVAVFVQTLHPLVMARRFVWRPGAEVEVFEASFEVAGEAGFLTSPVLFARKTGEPIRRRLADPGCPMDFPILSEFRVEGVTDYLVLPLHFTNGEIHVATFTTRQAGGFADAETAALDAILAPLTRVAEVRALRTTAVSLLNAYVGRDAGERILSGRIRRGETERIRAVIWLSDMRGFTNRADTMPPEALIDLLNLFFDKLVPAIEAEGGEVLKFMGDGLLAIFRIAGDPEIDVARALRAAREARANVAELAAPKALRFGLALHAGEALYGNIGAGARLDFTCIGPAVNMAARLEKVAAKLGRVVVASETFARLAPDDFTNLGDFELAGFREPVAVYGLRDEAE